MAKPKRLVTRASRQQREQFAQAEQALRDLPLEGFPARQRAAILTARRALRRQAHAEESIWPGGFNMIGRVRVREAWQAIRHLPASERPVQVRDAFLLVLLAVEKDEPELPFTRQEIAEEIGCEPRHVSTIMGTLERLGVLTRQRRLEPGQRGLGRVVYVVNVDTAWNGDLVFRRQVSAKQRQQQAERRRAKLKLVPPAEAAE